MKKIFIASDHGGFELKAGVLTFLNDKYRKEYEIVDLGTYSEDSVDYPDYGHKVGNSVTEDLKNNLGIVICGTGIGISISANKVKGIRAALCHSVEYAKLCREHNNANVLAMGGRFIAINTAKDMIDTFLSTEFEGGRHIGRVEAIEI